MKYYKKYLKEEIFVKPYSVQAIARKRNMLMNSLQLNDQEFMNWVRDRLYRVSQQNRISIKDMKIDLIIGGFREWENVLRQGDKDFDQYSEQFTTYTQKFIKFSGKILQNTIIDSTPGKLNPTQEEIPPVSPKMMKFQASDNA